MVGRVLVAARHGQALSFRAAARRARGEIQLFAKQDVMGAAFCGSGRPIDIGDHHRGARRR